MLKFTHEHWKKKAEEEYYSAVNEQEKAKQEEQHMFEWNRRKREGNWLLKGVSKVEDSKMNVILDEKKARDRRNKYNPEVEEQKREKIAKEKAAAKAKQTNENNKGKTNYYQMTMAWLNPPQQKKTDRARNARFVVKESIATMLVSRDVKQGREEFINENSKHIRVLQNVRLALNKPKLPAHHCDLSLMKDSDPPMSAEIAAEIGEQNLRTYKIPEKERIIEILRSVDEVKEEEIERRQYKVPSKFHQFLGLHRIYALRCFPATHEALHGKHVAREIYPEDELLPDYAAMDQERQKKKQKKRWLRSKIIKIHKDKLDMSRKQFKFTTTPQILPIHEEENSTIVSQDVRYNTEFQWKQRQFEERNSVYSNVHGEVKFKQPLQNIDNTIIAKNLYESSQDDSTIDTSVKLYLLNDQMSISEEGLCTTGQTVAATITTNNTNNNCSTISTTKVNNTNHNNYNSSNTTNKLSSEIYSHDEFESINAIRSNYFSQGSTKTNPLIHIPMVRHRKVKHLQGKHIKNLHLESKKTQLYRKEMQELQNFTRPHTSYT